MITTNEDPIQSDGELIASIAKNTTERVLVQRTAYRGYDLLDLRIFYRSDDGEWRPTRKGFTLRTDRLPELRAALADAADLIGEPE